MEYGCPLCNGLIQEVIFCPQCGQPMEDVGVVEDYYGPYSPYENAELYNPPEERNAADLKVCVHLFSCPTDASDTRVGFQRMILP